MRTLWLAVINQCLVDYKAGSFYMSSMYLPKYKRTLPREFFFSEDFELLCKWAGVNASMVRSHNNI